MPSTPPEHNPLADLIAAHEERLGILRIQAARKGDDTPAEITSEIGRITDELAHLKQAAAAAISPELVEELGAVGRYQVLIGNIMRLDADIISLARSVRELDTRVDAHFDELRNHTDQRFDELRNHIDGRLDTILLALARPAEPPLRPARPAVLPHRKAGRR